MSAADYERIEQAIHYLQDNHLEQPELHDVAESAGLSEYHFQRLFQRWAGISPKRFLQYLTAEHARELLAQSRSVLSVSFESGLSGGGRLHDLFVQLHAVTPGEQKAQGAGLVISYGVHDSPFGSCMIAVTDRGVCGLSFLEGDDVEGTSALSDLRARWSGATLVQGDAATRDTARRIFGVLPANPAAPLSVLVKGTNFQVKVWEALLRIPAGQVASYEDVAASIGSATALRAVGSAVARNPIAYLIPCHRVIRKSGVLGEYHWGPVRKKAMLVWESAHAEEARRAG
jgi:AraC family transcriptional regulator, regulatory protein of adaptative response / methylated-DNA-[protein]-cysteine methyltransferase